MRLVLGDFFEAQCGQIAIAPATIAICSLEREKRLIAPLALDEAAVAQLSGLPGLHRDPFDRMLVCQANANGLTLASSDPLLRKYPVALL